ncbi:acetyl-CoA synthetase-like protein [Penicillium hordei]|uniref:Acetyl-CoA synthetase-like protein n=1 Tax=Penicillium hordei TaxID=40994 RepID=A0AAD6H478_9EURO|nr:acetyl-CoA synthetase-like protein [Penicillium hordei]KAJ5602409.1 acetyl-CoA synthetase-like protein [Penicillium hordei]
MSSQLEITLQTLYSQILKLDLDQIGADDDFFRLRGDSIAAMRLVAAARQENLTLTVADVFNHPILCDLAKHARLTTAKESSSPHSCDLSSSVASFSLLPKEHHRQKKVWEQALSLCGLKREEVEDIYPTTALQEGLMALTAQKTGMYTAQLILSLSPGVDVKRLQDAWQCVVDSNAILRTRIVPTEDVRSIQVVVKNESISWTTIPTAHFPSLELYLAHDLADPMSFGQRLVRFALVNSSCDHGAPTTQHEELPPNSSQTMVLSMHHAIHDRWSISNLLRQVDDAYHGMQLKYQDFSPFISRLVRQDEDAVRKFWTSEFDGLEVAEFPSSATPVPNDDQTAPRGSVNCAVPINLPHDSRYTVSNLIRLAWAIVVSAYTQSEDVVFGLTVLGRGAAVPRIDEMTGPTVATVPFRVSVKANDTVERALTTIQNHVTDLIMYEQTGIQNIRKISPEAAIACNFRSHLGIQPPLSDNTKGSGSRILSLSSSATDYTLYASYPLLIVCGLPGENNIMDIQVNFDTAALSEAQTSRIMSQFVHVLRQICTTQAHEISKIEVICEDEMAQLRSWNSSLPVSTDLTVHDMVLQHCMKKPNDLAISTSHETVSFGALSRLSERLAEILISLGVQKNSIVALCFEKSIWPVVGMMGIMRAGATCVNIDPTLPVSRVRQMLTTTNSEFALASPSRKQHLEECSPGPLKVLALSSLSDVTDPVPTLSASARGRIDGEMEFLAPPTDAFRTEAFRACEKLKALLPPYMIPAMLLPLWTLPLTKTSKTDRKVLREEVVRMPIEMFSKYEGATRHEGQGPSRKPSTIIEIQLQQIWSSVLNIECDRIGLDDTFHSLGGESISAMQVVARSRSSGLVVTVANILRSKTIALLAKCVQVQEVSQDTLSGATYLEEDQLKGEFQLSPIQQMFFEVAPEGHNHFNQSFLLRLTRRVDAADISRAITTIVEHHPMLRARFHRHPDGQWTQKVLTKDPVSSFSFRSHAVHSRLEVDSISAQSQNSLDIKNGPLMAVDIISVGQEELYLHLLAHHLVIDFVSWRIIFQDLEELLSLGRITGSKSSSFQGWIKAQAEYAATNIRPELALPLHSPDDINLEQFWGVTPSENTYEAIHQRSFKISPHATSLLFGEANKAFDTQAVEIFQAAVLHSFVQTFSNRPAPTIFTEGHGREPWDSSIDLTRTVGWFTTMWPVHVPLTPEDDILEAVRQTKDSRRLVPANGWQYFVSRYHNAEGRVKFYRDGPVEILFNYVGLYQQLQRPDSLFRLERKDQQPDIAAGVKRFALVDISVSVVDGCLAYTFFTNGSMKHQDGLATWVQRCESSLHEASERLVATRLQYTLSNFPMLPSLTYNDLDRFMEHTLPDLGLVNHEIEDIYPCSPVQRGILLSQAKNPHQYLDVAIWRVSLADDHAVDIPRLQSAWQQVVDRHPILRTIFIPVSGCNYPDQVVLRRIQAEIQVCELSNSSKPRTFSAQTPLHSRHRLFITKEPKGSVRMELLISHSLIDGGSNPIIQRDLSMAYDGTLSSSLPPVYRNYISYLEDQQSQYQLSKHYWQEYVKGLEPCLFPNLRALSSEDKDDTPFEGTKSVVETLNLSGDVQSFCKAHGFTATNLVHVSWALVLRCFTGTDDVCFGYLTSGRDIPIEGIEDAVGPFFNLLVRRIHLPQTSPIISVLSDTQDTILDNLSHQHYPLADLYHAHGLAGQSLFNTLVSVQQFRVDDHASNLILEHEGGHDPTEASHTPYVMLPATVLRK